MKMASAEAKDIPAFVKQSVRAVLLSKIDGVLLCKFSKDYRNLLEESVPYSKHGFRNLEAFLRAMPDVVRFEYSKLNMDWRLYGIGAPNTYMSEHAKKAQGNPGHDVDRLDCKKKRNRGGAKPYSRGGLGSFSCPTRKPDGGGDTEGILIHGHNGLYTLCCPLLGNCQEDILRDFRTVADVAETSLSRSYLFTRYRSKEDAFKVLGTFSSKYSVRPALDRMSERKTEAAQRPSPLDTGTPARKVSSGKSKIVNGVEIYIGNIPRGWTERQVEGLLNGLEVVNLRIKVKDGEKSFAFGTLSSQDALLAVDRLNDRNVEKRRLICRLAHPDPAKAGRNKGIAKLNLDTVTSLVKMGFPVEGSRRAVYHTGDRGVNEAITWIQQHENDHDFNKPFTVPEITESASTRGPGDVGRNAPEGGFRPNPTALAMLMDQGVTRERATEALQANRNKLRAAEAWIMEHVEEVTESQIKASPENRTEPSSRSRTHGVSVGQRLSETFSKKSPEFQLDQEAVDTLLSYGLPRETVVKALEATNNNLDAAADWIMYNTEELRSALETVEASQGKSEHSTMSDNQLVKSTVDVDSTARNSNGTHVNQPVKSTSDPKVEPSAVMPSIEPVEHIATEMPNGLPLKPHLNNNTAADSDDDDMPSLEDDDDLPDLEDDLDEAEGSVAGQSTDSNSLSTESDGRKVSIFVGNFPIGTTQVALLEIFAEYQPMKITMVNNNNPYKNTYAFLVLPSAEIAEAAIVDMSGEDLGGQSLLVGMAFIDRGYNEPPEEEEPEPLEANGEEAEAEPSGGLPDRVEMFDSLVRSLWPSCRLLENGLYGRLELQITSVVDERFFFGHVVTFEKEMVLLSQINDALNEACQRRPPEKKTPLYRCAALYEDNWYRAYNMGEAGQGKQQAVLFVDYGNVEFVRPEDLRRPDVMRFWEDPAVAKPFQLVGRPLTDYPYTEGSTVVMGTVPKEEEDWNSVTKVRVLESYR